MVTRFHSWWQYIRKHRVAAIITAFVVVMVLIFAGYWFDWTGFNGYNKVTIAHTISGTNAGTVTKTEEYQPAKTLWDWLGLLAVLAIPVVAGIGAAWFTAQLGKASDRRNSLEQMKNQKIIENQFQQSTLQSYLDRMSELLLDRKLRLSTEDNEVRKVARARTLAALLSLDGVHKGNLLQFLSESGLIRRNTSVIDLHHADLSSTNLHGAVLRSVDLAGANLSNANLSEAYLSEADLSEANLIQANLSGANLSQANLNKAYLARANLYGADLSEANLRGANLNAAFLETASLFEANLEEAYLEKANLELANLFGANLRGAKLSGANLSNALVEDEMLWFETHSLKGATMPDGSIHP